MVLHTDLTGHRSQVSHALNAFTKQSLDQHRAVAQKALDWRTVRVMSQELELELELQVTGARR